MSSQTLLELKLSFNDFYLQTMDSLSEFRECIINQKRILTSLFILNTRQNNNNIRKLNSFLNQPPSDIIQRLDSIQNKIIRLSQSLEKQENKPIYDLYITEEVELEKDFELLMERLAIKK